MQDGYVCVIYYKGDEKMYDIISITHNTPTQALKEMVEEINSRVNKGWSLRGDYTIIETKDGKFVVSHAMTKE